jgi:hypothetical protein
MPLELAELNSVQFTHVASFHKILVKNGFPMNRLRLNVGIQADIICHQTKNLSILGSFLYRSWDLANLGMEWDKSGDLKLAYEHLH